MNDDGSGISNQLRAGETLKAGTPKLDINVTPLALWGRGIVK